MVVVMKRSETEEMNGSRDDMGDTERMGTDDMAPIVVGLLLNTYLRPQRSY